MGLMSMNCEAVFWAVLGRFHGNEFDVNKATNNLLFLLFNVNVFMGKYRKKSGTSCINEAVKQKLTQVYLHFGEETWLFASIMQLSAWVFWGTTCNNLSYSVIHTILRTAYLGLDPAVLYKKSLCHLYIKEKIPKIQILLFSWFLINDKKHIASPWRFWATLYLERLLTS